MSSRMLDSLRLTEAKLFCAEYITFYHITLGLFLTKPKHNRRERWLFTQVIHSFSQTFLIAPQAVYKVLVIYRVCLIRELNILTFMSSRMLDSLRLTEAKLFCAEYITFYHITLGLFLTKPKHNRRERWLFTQVMHSFSQTFLSPKKTSFAFKSLLIIFAHDLTTFQYLFMHIDF